MPLLSVLLTIFATLPLTYPAHGNLRQVLRQSFGLAREAETYFASQTCSDLFSDVAPAEIAQSEYLGLRLLGRTWAPLCSLAIQNSIRTRNLAAGPGELNRLLVSAVLDQDQCRPPAPSEPERPLRQSYRRHRALLRMSERSIRQVVAGFVILRSLAANTCCRGNQQCEGLINRVRARIGWMQVFEDHEASALYNAVERTVVFSPFETDFGTPVTSAFAIAHEFGHACAYAWAEIYGVAGRQHPVSLYRRLFLQQGAEPGTYQCLIDLNRPRGLRDLASGACPWQDPGARMKEAFADFFAFMVMPEERVVPEVLPTACMRGFDYDHGSSWAQMRCFLLSENLQNKLMRATGCRAGIGSH